MKAEQRSASSRARRRAWRWGTRTIRPICDSLGAVKSASTQSVVSFDERHIITQLIRADNDVPSQLSEEEPDRTVVLF